MAGQLSFSPVIDAKPIRRVRLVQQTSPTASQPPSTNVHQLDAYARVQGFVQHHVLGPNNQHCWFWFVVLFVFCIFC